MSHTYRILDNQVEPAACYDDSFDAVIFKNEDYGYGPVTIRQNGVKHKVNEGRWMYLDAAIELAEREGLPYGIV